MKEEKLIAYGKNIIVTMPEAAKESTSTAGIIIPKKDLPTVRAAVWAIGDEIPGFILNSDVLFNRDAGSQFDFNGNTYKVLDLSQVLAVIVK